MTTGIWNTGNFTQNMARLSFAAMITRLMPNGSAPLFGMTAMLPTTTAVQIEHGFFTKSMLFPSMNLDAAALIGDTVFTVASTANVVPGMIFRVDSTFENIIVNSVLSPTQVSVQRQVGTVAAQAIADDINLYQVGNAYEEASLRPNAVSINPVRVVNLTQIFRNTWALSGTAAATQMIAGDTNIAENRQDCAAFHAADIEKAIFFGQKFQGTRNGQPFRTMDGLISIITQTNPGNITTLGATTNYTQFENATDVAFNTTTDPKTSSDRILFVGGAARRVINSMARLNGTYFIADGQTSYGLRFNTIKTARGTFNIVEHPLFNAFGASSSWAKMAVAVDLSAFRLAYMAGRKTQNKEFNMDGQVVDNGIDAVGGTLTTELTLEVRNPAAMAVMYNFTAAATG